MQQTRQISLFIAIFFWAVILGGLTYSHIVYYPNYLSHLPESTILVNNKYGLKEDKFWIIIHPLIIVSTAAAFILNWKITERRKYLLITIYIYVLAMVVTAIYFYPEVIEFSQSNRTNTVSPKEWHKRGQIWLVFSSIRLFFVYIAFASLLIAVTRKKLKHKTQTSSNNFSE
ncbi:hypothetical protein FEDK69T_17500 [Flavobacterium enshiense DK69]|uniref:DUF1772 domain-containing protein n=1 Tax=Flavobacterium enshiense DK69 TaxID=1107311 RepID=V6S9C8_9FLAO|nr:hypothetical protein [Flavobacterium enshiense]ESU22847.1 hypothetical protein FEDK69T_17500 [Flavobacterium enshiense DK69]KGO93984.1 hypothetical protein Q767_13655 [Flavobacterium enshiense DK69]